MQSAQLGRCDHTKLRPESLVVIRAQWLGRQRSGPLVVRWKPSTCQVTSAKDPGSPAITGASRAEEIETEYGSSPRVSGNLSARWQD